MLWGHWKKKHVAVLTMRVLVYGVAAYILSTGSFGAPSKFAFVARPVGSEIGLKNNEGATRSMGRQSRSQSLRMQVHEPQDDPDVAARVDALLSLGGRDSIHTVAATFETAFTGPAAEQLSPLPASGAKKQTYNSYALASLKEAMDSKTISSTASHDHAMEVLARVAEMMKKCETPSAADTRLLYSPPVGYQPRAKRVDEESSRDANTANIPRAEMPYGPASRRVLNEQADIPTVERMRPASSPAQANSLPSSWSPPSGYAPARRTPQPSSIPHAHDGGSGHTTSQMAQSNSAPAQSDSVPIQSCSESDAPMSSAPAKKWEPYGGGYDPKARRASGVASVPVQVVSSTLLMFIMALFWISDIDGVIVPVYCGA